MAITAVKVHPAIGVARLGNSPGDFFIGPERTGVTPDPPGGFKDAQCRVKRQAARFRVYAHHDDGTVSELTAADAEITWTVHIANKKVATRYPADGSAADLTIDPGPRTLTGPDQRSALDGGKITLPGASEIAVPMGEIRTDADGRLLVLGGFGTSASPTNTSVGFPSSEGWYDDVADGSVAAHVKIHAGGGEHDAAGAWVLVAPPKFAPALEMPTTLHDRIFDVAASQGWVSAPATPSYTNDIYPILLRARNIGAVAQAGGAHTWSDPIYDQMAGAITLREHIFDKLVNPSGGGGDMPALSSSTATAWSHLTPTQYTIMQRWKDDDFLRDWSGPPAPPAIAPAVLDEAALRACVGAAFFPGIEAGGTPTVPVIDHNIYVGAADPMRIDHARAAPGDLTAWMALPWQGDFYLCGATWWPVPRPDFVVPQGGSTGVDWVAGNVGSMGEMVTKWSTLGFVVDQGGSYVEVERCATTFVALLTPHLDFQDVPQGPMGMVGHAALAVVFEVSAPAASVTLEVKPGQGPSSPRLKVTPSVTVGPTSASAIAEARLWVTYETGPAGEHLADQLVVTDAASGETWTVTITANTVGRKVAATVLVLDRSGSMADDAGGGQSKHASLQQAASIMVDVMPAGDAIGLVSFADAATALQPVTVLGDPTDPFDAARKNTHDAIAGPGLAPGGNTSIGAGIALGTQQLASAGSGYDVKSLVVLTDGVENRPPSIADVAGDIDANTYAIGLGTPQNISTAALQTISGNNGGYLLLTGAIAGDNRFLLQKYFLQILAGISNAEIVLDPQGVLVPGVTQRIPFRLTEGDAGVDVILLTPDPEAVELLVQAPSGTIITPATVAGDPTMAFVAGSDVEYYRIVLPVEFEPSRFDGAGIWQALLTMRGRDVLTDASAVAQRRTLPYSLVVHSYSNLSMRASLEQHGLEPGATIALHATLAESGMPAQAGAYVRAEVTRPDGSSATVALVEAEGAHFSATFATTVAGIYRVRVRATGRSSARHPFQREQTLTAGVWRGASGGGQGGLGGSGGLGGQGGLGGAGDAICRLLRCLEETLCDERGSEPPRRCDD